MMHNRVHSGRTAFTLVEVLLALAVVVMIAAITWPALRGPLELQRLRTAADQVRAAWLTARANAMSSGQIQVFRYEPNGRQYLVAAWETEDDLLQAAAGSASAAAMPSAAPSLHRDLPEGIMFAAVDQAADVRGAVLFGGGDASGIHAGLTAPPIMFYPDGSTSTVALTLQNDDAGQIVVALRGLTGVVSVEQPTD